MYQILKLVEIISMSTKTAHEHMISKDNSVESENKAFYTFCLWLEWLLGEVYMEDIVTIVVQLEDGEERFFMTWGRIQDIVDPEPLEQLVFKYCTDYGLGGKPVKARMCYSLQEAAHAPFFYETFFSFCQEPIPPAKKYQAWKKKIKKRMQKGEELAYLGNPNQVFNPRE